MVGLAVGDPVGTVVAVGVNVGVAVFVAVPVTVEVRVGVRVGVIVAALVGVIVGGMDPAPPKKLSSEGACAVSPISGRPSISSHVLSALKWEIGFPLGTDTLEPDTIDGAIKTFGIGVSSSQRKKIATSPAA